jgi:hypothetical protein
MEQSARGPMNRRWVKVVSGSAAVLCLALSVAFWLFGGHVEAVVSLVAAAVDVGWLLAEDWLPRMSTSFRRVAVIFGIVVNVATIALVVHFGTAFFTFLGGPD